MTDYSILDKEKDSYFLVCESDGYKRYFKTFSAAMEYISKNCEGKVEITLPKLNYQKQK